MCPRPGRIGSLLTCTPMTCSLSGNLIVPGSGPVEEPTAGERVLMHTPAKPSFSPGLPIPKEVGLPIPKEVGLPIPKDVGLPIPKDVGDGRPLVAVLAVRLDEHVVLLRRPGAVLGVHVLQEQ